MYLGLLFFFGGAERSVNAYCRDKLGLTSSGTVNIVSSCVVFLVMAFKSYFYAFSPFGFG